MGAHKDYAKHNRRDYSRDALDEKDLMANPIELFDYWFNEAVDKGVADANAMSIATVDSFGHPYIRVVLMRDYTSGGFTFFTNYESLKGQQIEGNRNVCLHFFWKELFRQVRIQGAISKVDPSVSEAYFSSRPRENQAAAVASPQSTVIPDREFLDKRYHAALEAHPHHVPKPVNWGGYIVNPHSFEFWQGRMSRMHDRFIYSLHTDGLWKIDRLAP